MKYKEFYGQINYLSEDRVFFGKIENVSDLVTFEAPTLKGLFDEFKAAVDDYLLTLNSLRNE